MLTAYQCPGAASIRGTPTLETRICPQCGAEIDLFSCDMQVPCTCGFIAYNNMQSCISWCAYAKQCVGEERYERYRKKRSTANL
ncbi:MAG: hypothetical protein LBU17_03610 [Treponema sp.]|jgi:hypothetical protein|nr:hypothetical protein [Treponema sp.]